MLREENFHDAFSQVCWNDNLFIIIRQLIFIITIPIGKENVDTVIQTVCANVSYWLHNMPLDPILYINSVNVYGWLVYKAVKVWMC